MLHKIKSLYALLTDMLAPLERLHVRNYGFF